MRIPSKHRFFVIGPEQNMSPQFRNQGPPSIGVKKSEFY